MQMGVKGSFQLVRVTKFNIECKKLNVKSKKKTVTSISLNLKLKIKWEKLKVNSKK